MKLIIGLGNPGIQYKQTRHNVGFLFLDYLQKKLGFSEFKEEKKFFGEISEGDYLGEKFVLLKPMTFMNNSGNSVIAIKNFYKINIEDIIIIYDDKDIFLNNIRFREKGSSGGHNGMRDIIDVLKTEEIARIKIGIAYINSMIKDTADFVLSKLNNEELLKLDGIFEKTKVMLEKWIQK